MSLIEPGEMTIAELEELIERCTNALATASPHALVTVQIDVAQLRWLAGAALFWESRPWKNRDSRD